MEECKSLVGGVRGVAAAAGVAGAPPRGGGAGAPHPLGAGRGLHSFTFQLNLSALYEIGGARRGCVARVKGC